MSIGKGNKRNNKKEKGNRYCDHNMVGDYNTGTDCYLNMGNTTVICITNAVMSRTWWLYQESSSSRSADIMVKFCKCGDLLSID